MFRTACHFSLYWAWWIHSVFFHPIFLRSILILSSNLCLCLWGGFFPLVTQPKPCMQFSSLPLMSHVLPISSPLIYHLNNIWLGVLIMLSWLCYFFQSPVTSHLLGPNIFSSTLFSNTLSLYSCPVVVDQVSHPHYTNHSLGSSKDVMQSQDLCSIPSVTPYQYPLKRQSVTFLKPAAECSLLVRWPHLELLTWQPPPTHQLSYLGSAWIVPCCTMSLRRREFSVSVPSQMWIFCGSHSDVVSWIYARTCTWADGDRTGAKFDSSLLGRMITGICHRHQVTSYKCWISQVLLGVTLWDRVPNETNELKPKRWMVLNVVYQYHCQILK